jgi:hypothetical protein
MGLLISNFRRNHEMHAETHANTRTHASAISYLSVSQLSSDCMIGVKLFVAQINVQFAHKIIVTQKSYFLLNSIRLKLSACG